MENICTINWKDINNCKELEQAIIEWCDRDLKDIDSLTRTDLLKLILIHNLEEHSTIKYEPDTGLTRIKIEINGRSFYGIKNTYCLSFVLPEFGDHIMSFSVERNYGEIKQEDFYRFTHSITTE